VNVLDTIHGQYVSTRRVRVLCDHLTPLFPPGNHILDVGCGDGLLARRIADRRPDVTIRGIDVLVRADTAIPVEPFDGKTIPLDDASVDTVLFVDVLHHTTDPLPLLHEAARVARSGVVIKDHLREGALAGVTLRLMDWVGNARHGVALPYNYLSRQAWMSAFKSAGLAIDCWCDALHLYPPIASQFFDRSLHFIARLRHQ
jgi:ubiquinone/menaquinone biosynthesis C-methylase UbiE